MPRGGGEVGLFRSQGLIVSAIVSAFAFVFQLRLACIVFGGE